MLDSTVFPTAVSYVGDVNVIDREISMQERVSTNVTGDRLFPAAITSSRTTLLRSVWTRTTWAHGWTVR